MAEACSLRSRPLHRLQMREVLFAPGTVYQHLMETGGLVRLLVGFFPLVALYGAMVALVAPEARLCAAFLAVTNALVMAPLIALCSWLSLQLVGWQAIPVGRVIPAVAYGFGVSFLVAWVPGSLGISELWKWTVMGIGFHRLTGLKRSRVLMAMAMVWSILMGTFKVWLVLLAR